MCTIAKTVMVWRKWACHPNWRCNHKVLFCKYSFFSGSQLPLSAITKIIYYYTIGHTGIRSILHFTKLRSTPIQSRTFITSYKRCVALFFRKTLEQMGGPGKIIEIDECKFGERKYNKGKHVEGQWVFGGTEHDSHPTKCFFVPVDDRSAATLIPIITNWILPETTTASDCWKVYSSLQAEGYIH